MNRNAVFVACILGLSGAALAFRLPHLELRPVHTDEAVHMIKFDTLWQTGRYEYDPVDYHGPTLYYAALPVVWLSGAKDLAHTTASMFRVVPVIFSVGVILLLFLLADGLVRPAAVCAGILTVLSPATSYYSRYYIQETLLVFFTFLAIVAGWRYIRTRRVAWAILAGGAFGLMSATKETWVLALGCMAVALAITALWCRPVHATSPRPMYLRPGAVASAVLVMVIVSGVLLSGFFTNTGGPLDALRAVTHYTARAGTAGLHVHPWYYYLQMLTYWRAGAGPAWSEGLIVGLSIVGIIAAIRGRTAIGGHVPLLRFVALYTVLMTTAYSLIPYKTPWCILSALHGMILLAGAGAVTLLQAVRPAALRIGVAAVLVVAGIHLGWQSLRANSDKFCNSERNPYVYAQTLRDTVALPRQLNQLAQVHPDGHRMLIKVIVENCWPLPWYLRQFERVGYWEAVPEPPDSPDADVILAAAQFQAELETRLTGSYEISHHGLRRDQRLLLYVRQDLWNTLQTHLRSSTTYPATRPTDK